MKSPAEKIVEWLGTQPDDLQQELLFLIAYQMPDSDRNLPLDIMGEAADFKAEFAKVDGSNSKDLALVVSFIGLFDLEIDAARGQMKDWDKVARSNAEMAEALEKDGKTDLAEKLRSSVTNTKEHAQRWIDLVASWRDFAARELTRDYLRQWSHNALMKRVQEFRGAPAL